MLPAPRPNASLEWWQEAQLRALPMVCADSGAKTRRNFSSIQTATAIRKPLSKRGVTGNSQAIPLDGVASQTPDANTNRITTTGHEYDNAGNMTRGKTPDGTLQRYEYDSAGRLFKIKTDANVLIEEYTYGASRERLKKETKNYAKRQMTWFKRDKDINWCDNYNQAERLVEEFLKK